jgi:hypothetical protein
VLTGESPTHPARHSQLRFPSNLTLALHSRQALREIPVQTFPRQLVELVHSKRFMEEQGYRDSGGVREEQVRWTETAPSGTMKPLCRSTLLIIIDTSSCLRFNHRLDYLTTTTFPLI